MNFSNILNEIANAGPQVFEKADKRRNMIKNLSRKAALTALPFALGASAKKAQAQSSDSIVVNTLNFILDIKNLTSAFYADAVVQVLFPDSETKSAFTTLANQEQAHVRFLKKTIVALGGTVNAVPLYDFTLQGALAPFSSFPTLLIVAQVLEDTCVRSLKGQAASLMNDNAMLTALLNIHSIDARHASYIRLVRARVTGGTANVKPWITGNQTGIQGTPSFKDTYAGEQAATQAGIAIAGIGGQDITAAAATEAFDEPITKNETLEILKPFIVA